MPLDIGIGIFGAIITAHLTGIPLDWRLVFVGALFSVLPDIDFAVYFAKKRKLDIYAHEHRDILHDPIPYIIVGFAILSLYDLSIAWLFAALSFWHFLHDSIPEGGGWGIKWLFPFIKTYFKFFSGPNGKASKNPVMSWTYLEQRKAAKKFGDPDWAMHYLHSWEFLMELAVFAAAVASLVALRS